MASPGLQETAQARTDPKTHRRVVDPRRCCLKFNVALGFTIMMHMSSGRWYSNPISTIGHLLITARIEAGPTLTTRSIKVRMVQRSERSLAPQPLVADARQGCENHLRSERP